MSKEEPDVDDDNTLPSLQTKSGEDEAGDDTQMNDILISPPSMKRSIVNEESTITSNLTMDNNRRRIIVPRSLDLGTRQ